MTRMHFDDKVAKLHFIITMVIDVWRK